jgi:uncharacterized protein (DUF2141 family)
MNQSKLLLSLVFFCGVSNATQPLVVSVSGFKDQNGQLICNLYSSKEGFPTENRNAILRVKAAIASDLTGQCKFEIEPGVYAVSVAQDLNKNDKVDLSMVGAPTEPWAVSRNAPARTFGPPRFEKASFKFPEDGQEVVTLTLQD